MRNIENIQKDQTSSQHSPSSPQTAGAVEEADLSLICDALHNEFTAAAASTLCITGGAGFLGFYLTKAILHWNQSCAPSDRINILLMDAFMRGRPNWITDAIGQPNFHVVKQDVTQEPGNEFDDSDFIIHAASIASPIYYREHPIETMDANVIGLRRLLDLAVKRQSSVNPLAGMLYFSTSEIYGDPDPSNIPTPEIYRGNVSCTGPRACYDESKRYGETLCVNFARQYNVPVSIARPFNNYGPGLKITDKRAPPDFANDILNDRDIVLLSDGSPTRTFCYIADAIIGYYKVLFKGTPGESYNIGNDAPEVSIKNFAQKNVATARTLFDYTGDVKFARSEDADYLTDNPHRRCPNIDKARSQLHFEPTVSLDEGIHRSLVWYRENRDGDES